MYVFMKDICKTVFYNQKKKETDRIPRLQETLHAFRSDIYLVQDWVGGYKIGNNPMFNWWNYQG